MTIIPNGEIATPVISNDGWYPDIDPDHARSAIRIDDDVSNEVLVHLLSLSIRRINLLLENFRVSNASSLSMSDIAAPQVGSVSVLVTDYYEAVYTLTKADILDSYSDTDSTVVASGSTEKKADTAKDFRARSTHAIRRLSAFNIGNNKKINVELI